MTAGHRSCRRLTRLGFQGVKVFALRLVEGNDDNPRIVGGGEEAGGVRGEAQLVGRAEVLGRRPVTVEYASQPPHGDRALQQMLLYTWDRDEQVARGTVMIYSGRTRPLNHERSHNLDSRRGGNKMKINPFHHI
ncbi:hypothetical protein EYF80_055569 [Liparis tanakae]|uniref:Uncharacterized protein n=1 Tax=Liparis tanakae TaxID=230148 RepID=A0A4Z2EZ73_9TELE|nr:hypothetical protein EYF80_055569 [Liparis tanakae]